jgi:NodT family efflux transporter outer membrane factor (OMF) lipoprotein
MKRCLLSLSVLCTILIIGSCSIFKPEIRQSPEGEIPEAFSLYATDTDGPSKWWKALNSSELNALITQALSKNLSIRQAWARINQANSIAVQKGANLYPDLYGTMAGSITRQKITTEAGTGTPPVLTDTETYVTSENYSLGLSSSYELDLWGKIRSGRQAALLDATATREDLNTVAISIAAQVAETWVNIIAQRIQLRLLDKQLETNLKYLKLIELRFRKGMVSALDVYQQKQVVEQVKAQIPLVEAAEQKLLHILSTLIGKPPLYPITITQETLPLPENTPDIGLPADLLANRPDIRAAGMRLEAADWQVSVARASRLPSISITATASYGSDELSTVFDNWLANLAGNLLVPVFTGRQLSAEVDRTRAVVDERLMSYRDTVLNAIKEVEDALVSEQKQRAHIAALELQLDAAQKAFDEAVARYLKGLNEYLPVLNQIIAINNLERDIIQRKAELIAYRINLHRALGGTWTDELKTTSSQKSNTDKTL